MNNSIFNFSDEHFLMFTTRHIDNHKNNMLKNIFIKYNLDYNNIVNLKQIHSNNLLYAEKPGYYNNYDGIITNKLSKIIPVIMTADCIPLFVYDAKNKYYGLLHCGWRGIISKIHLKAILMLKNHSIDSENIKIVFGPSIMSCCYEVGAEMLKYFSVSSIEKKEDKYFLNLQRQITEDLITMGIKRKNIFYSNICTFEDLSCCSFRRDREESGRMYSVIFPL